MKIDVLYFKGCPHADKALKLVKSALEELKIQAIINFIEIKDLEDAKQHKFYGSPSIQINGVDIEEGEENRDILFGCRVYQTEEGFSGLPPKKLLITKIIEARENKN